MLKSFRYVLFPFAFLHWLIVCFRNFLFDKKIVKSATFNFPIICVGNIAVGGTGKTPMTEYLIDLLKTNYRVATLSRGYKRRTKGFAIATSASTPLEIGDEPMQLLNKHSDITVAVGEERLVAIPQILYLKPDTEVMLLDDAFQHRAVSAGLNILLTDCNNPYTRDFLFPTGDLRDNRSSVKRADIIVVTKCAADMSAKLKQSFINEINPLPHQKVLFTCLEYGTPYHLFDGSLRKIQSDDQLLLICGIANPAPLKQYLNQTVFSYEMKQYRDHHIFSSSDLEDILLHFDRIQSQGKYMLTTEKDAVRLDKFKPKIAGLPVYVLPVKHKFLFGEEDAFRHTVTAFIESYKQPQQNFNRQI